MSLPIFFTISYLISDRKLEEWVMEMDWELIREAQKIQYWSRIEATNCSLASFLIKSKLKNQIGLLNDHHIEIIDLYEGDSEECVRLYGLYNFELLFHRIQNYIKRFDGKEILRISYESDPEWDCSGETVKSGFTIDLGGMRRIYDLLGHYSGNTEATYVSGCGLRHRQVRDEILDMIRDFISDRSQIKVHQAMLELVGISEGSINDDNWEVISDYIWENVFDEFVLAEVSKLEI